MESDFESNKPLSKATLTVYSFPPHASDYPKLGFPSLEKPKLSFKTRLMIFFTRSNRHMMLHVEKMDVAITRAYLKSGVSPDIHDSTGTTALGYAVAAGHLQMAKLLLSRGADPNLLTGPNVEKLPLQVAIRRKNQAMADLLLDYGANINAEPDFHNYGNSKPTVTTELRPQRLMFTYRLIEFGDTDMFRFWLNRGALYKEKFFGRGGSCDPGYCTSPLRSAMAYKTTAEIDCLLDMDVLEDYERNGERCYHHDPLGSAIHYEDADLIRKFAARKMDLTLEFRSCGKWEYELGQGKPGRYPSPGTPVQCAEILGKSAIRALLESLIQAALLNDGPAPETPKTSPLRLVNK